MIIDVRCWSLFIFLAGFLLFVLSLATPFYIKGLPVVFGERGLWNIEDYSDDAGHYLVTQALLIVVLICLIISLSGYVVLCKQMNCPTQFVVFVSQAIAGLIEIVAVTIFGVKDPVRGQGWWMAAMSAVIILFNSIVILMMSYMEPDERHPYYRQESKTDIDDEPNAKITRVS